MNYIFIFTEIVRSDNQKSHLWWASCCIDQIKIVDQHIDLLANIAFGEWIGTDSLRRRVFGSHIPRSMCQGRRCSQAPRERNGLERTQRGNSATSIHLPPILIGGSLTKPLQNQVIRVHWQAHQAVWDLTTSYGRRIWPTRLWRHLQNEVFVPVLAKTPHRLRQETPN